MRLNFVDILMILAASQGLFLSVLIFHKHRNLFANRFLALMMLCFSVILYNLALSDLGYQLRFPRLSLILIGIPFLAIPLHFLYAKYLIRASDRHHPMNIRFDRRFLFRRSNLIFYFSIWNVYNRKNVASYFWNGKENRQDVIYQWRLLPVFGLEWEL